jgi:hypothetical protein
VSFDSKLDWRGGLLEAARRASPSSVQHAIETTLQAGVDAAAVKDFVTHHRAIFGDVAGVFDDVDTARRATNRLLDQTQPRLPAPPSSLTSTSGRAQRPHALRLDPSSSLPWHQRASLPPLPPAFPTGAATGAAADVVVQGERFSPRDVAAMLAGC